MTGQPDLFPPNSCPHPPRSAEEEESIEVKWEESKARLLERRKALTELLIQAEDCLAACDRRAGPVLA